VGGAAFLLALLIGAAAPQSNGYAVLPPDKASALLHQCSRSTVKPGESGWMPRARDIARLEARLPAALAQEVAGWDAAARAGLKNAPTGWYRQYVGIVRGGKRFIYGNFLPVGRDDWGHWRVEPMIVCDGGPAFFGTEYDVEKDEISDLAFNGSIA
jgi:hypothetical protein